MVTFFALLNPYPIHIRSLHENTHTHTNTIVTIFIFSWTHLKQINHYHILYDWHGWRMGERTYIICPMIYCILSLISYDILSKSISITISISYQYLTHYQLVHLWSDQTSLTFIAQTSRVSPHPRTRRNF